MQVNDKLHKISAASLREHSVLFETMLDSTADTRKPIPLGLEVEDACFAAIVVACCSSPTWGATTLPLKGGLSRFGICAKLLNLIKSYVLGCLGILQPGAAIIVLLTW